MSNFYDDGTLKTNKELTPLKALERIKNAPTIYVGCASDIYTRYPHEVKIIEFALTRLEFNDKLDKSMIWKGNFNGIVKMLQALNYLMTFFKVHVYHSRHSPTGFEMSVEDKEGNHIYQQISEVQFYCFLEVLKND